jgi:hypothetical protein
MRGWPNFMLRIMALCVLLVGALQANAACAGADLAAAHTVTSAGMDRGHGIDMAGHDQMAGHPSGGAVCVQACLSWIIEPCAAPRPAGFSTTAFLRPHQDARPPSLQPDTAERPPKPRV